MTKEYYQRKARDIMYECGDPEDIDRIFVENLVAELLERLDELYDLIKNR